MRRCGQQLLSAGWQQIWASAFSVILPMVTALYVLLVWFGVHKEERSVFMSLNNLTMDKGVKKKICQFLFMYVLCVYIYLFIYYLFYVDSCC